MKKTLLFSVFVFTVYSALGQNWTWMNGSSGPKFHGNYGIKNVPAVTNKPGARTGSVSWKDNTGTIWMFGGYGYASQGNKGCLNDLWKYDEANGIWTWMSGADTTGEAGLYGIAGIASNNTRPGARQHAGGWIDNSGKLWLFGGRPGIQATNLNDLWKYDPTSGQWTWVNGDSTQNQKGFYGTPTVASATNKPGSRSDFAFWKDKTGNFWLFGGVDTASEVMCGANDYYWFTTYRNDLWQYNPTTNEWTWMKGDSIYHAASNFGVQGVSSASNKPGARAGTTFWTDTSGNFWMLAGKNSSLQCYFSTQFRNDLWKYNVANNEWTWIKGDSTNPSTHLGTKGVPLSANKPGSGNGWPAWVDNATNKVWVLNNVLWQYDIAQNIWTWISGDLNCNGNYGTQGQSAASNEPGCRSNSISWIDNAGRFMLFGGTGFLTNGSDVLNDMWRYHPSGNHWTWLDGNHTITQISTYGTKGVFSPTNIPGARESAATWTDNNNNLWMFGGRGHSAQGGGPGLLNELWKYNPALHQWAWVAGDSLINPLSLYGTKGIAALHNNPAARQNAAFWKDRSGNLWLFGGRVNGGAQLLNDLWKYNTVSNEWTWVNGDSTTNTLAVYGTKNVSSPSNNPGAREYAYGWEDTSGNFWLFAGNRNSGSLNDMWKFDPLTGEWTWMHGDSIVPSPSVYGTPNSFSAAVKPTGTNGFYWKERSGIIWMFGDGNKLWKFNPSINQWAVVTGVHSPSNFNGNNRFGNKGFPDFQNMPGKRTSGGMWIDSMGDLWMYGGYGYLTSNPMSGSWELNTVWKYEPATNEWTWMQGDSTIVKAVYGVQGITAATNDPGSRRRMQHWQDTSGNFWFFGGETGAGAGNLMGDMWKRDGCVTPRKPTAFTMSTPFLCAGNNYVLSVPAQSSASNYVWSLPSTWTGISITDSINVIVQPYNWTEKLEVYATNVCGNSSKLRGGPTVSQPPTPVILQSGNNLYTNGLYIAYQWYLNGQQIPGAIFPNYIYTQNGNYHLEVTNNAYCTGVSNTISIITTVTDVPAQNNFQLYPNPTQGIVSVTSKEKGILTIRNLQGVVVAQFSITNEVSRLDLSNHLARGMYLATFFYQKQALAISALDWIIFNSYSFTNFSKSGTSSGFSFYTFIVFQFIALVLPHYVSRLPLPHRKPVWY